MNQKLLLPLLIFLAAPLAMYATHNRAGEIHIEQIGPLTIRATIITWTKTSSVNADRDTLEINWGDGIREKVLRSNGNGIPPEGVPLSNDIKYNTYVIEHTYAGPDSFVISMTDQNRIGGIINVNPPASDNVPFHIQTTYIFQDAQFGGSNTTPYLLQPPVDNACVGKPFKHNPNASDPDGDSLSYELIVPLQGPGVEVPQYAFPNEIRPGLNNSFFLDPVSGDILWDSPQLAGVYNIAFTIISWRKGKIIDITIRDMQIIVSACNNNPPVVETIDKICVVAGKKVEFRVSGNDVDSSNLILLTALGAPFTSPYSPAVFLPGPFWTKIKPVIDTFRWITACEHISNQPYTVVFKALDSLTSPQLADLHTVSIKVVGPSPEDVQANAEFGNIELSWEKPYSCEAAAEHYFLGFSVWRREGSNPFVVDTCDPGLAGKGYTQLIAVTKAVQNGRYYYKDTNVERGRTYCYRVLAKFARVSAGGYPYNIVESLASKEVCTQLPRDLPLITNVSVEATDAAVGKIRIAWSKPVGGDLDTILNPGPYRYQLLRAPGFSGGTFTDVPNASFVSNTFWQANDTIFEFDENLNTVAGPFRYRVDFYTANNLLGSTRDASSIFLTVASTDETNILSWAENVPWNNYNYKIFRKNDQSGLFDPIGTSSTKMYADRGLVNGKEYCYYVESEGTYSVGGLLNPLFNKSQENCGIPIDTVPPCAPVLSITNLCDDPNANPGPPYLNNLSWTIPNLTCEGTDDVVKYKVFYSAVAGAPLVLLTEQGDMNNNTFKHLLESQLAGCYAVSALDSVGNESVLSNVLCVDNCPNYELPNAFTPNGDGANDLYTPFPGWRFVQSVDMQIFNRWGNLVFQTTDPGIVWKGTNDKGNELAEGTYFYVCKVYESRVGGVVLRPGVLKGYIELIRG